MTSIIFTPIYIPLPVAPFDLPHILDDQRLIRNAAVIC
jgi:hypothetical protein